MFGYSCSCGATGYFVNRERRDAYAALHVALCVEGVQLWLQGTRRMSYDKALKIAAEVYYYNSTDRKCQCPAGYPPCWWCVDGWMKDISDPELLEALGLE